jgi:phage-related protein
MNTADNQAQLSQISARIIGETIRSRGTRTLLTDVAKDLISSWANKGGIRARVAPPARWVVAKVLRPGKNGKGADISADIGRLLTIWARKVNADHTKEPLCHAGTRGETIQNFLANTDFGEIREMVENSEPCVLKTVEAFNTHLWKYPAKVGSIIGTFLAATNTAIRSLREILKPIEKNIGPDLLADLLLSILKGLNAKETGKLTNSLCELIRRLHTGNYLLAKADKPLFQIYLTSFLQDALPNIDPVLLKKAKIALAEDREAMTNALADALNDNPGLIMEMISAYGSTKTPLIKSSSRKVRLFEEMDQDQLADAAAKGLSDLDTFEIAEVINGFLRTINSIHENRPEVFSTIAGSIADSVDAEELRAAAEWLIPEIVEANRPVIAAFMPAIINAVCDILCPQDGLLDEKQREAIGNLKTVLLAAGGEG